MKALLLIPCTDEAKAAADAVLAVWKDEHAGYYGKPHGARRILRGLESVPCGLSEAAIGAPESRYTIAQGWRWLTCGGNDHRIGFCSGSILVGYEGRRHGMRSEFREFLKAYWYRYEDSQRLCETQAGSFDPWQTTT